MTTVALYSRVSTGLQADANGTDAQDHAIRRWCADHGIDPDDAGKATRYQDLAESGTTMRRPAIQAMLAAVANGAHSTVVAYDLTRLARSLRGMVDIVETCKAARCRIVAIRDGVDTDQPTGTLFLHLLAVIGEWEAMSRRKTTSAAIEAWRSSHGHAWGGARSRQLIRTPEMVERIRSAYAEDRSVSRVAAKVGVSKYVVRTAIRSGAPTTVEA